MEVTLHESPTDGVSALRFSPTDTTLLASASWDCSVRLYDTAANTLRTTYKHKAPVLDVAFVGADKLVSGGLDRELLLYVVLLRSSILAIRCSASLSSVGQWIPAQA